MQNTKIQNGKQSIAFEKTPYVHSYASIVGPKEGEGPLAYYFDMITKDFELGQNTWEEAESQLVTLAIKTAIKKGNLKPEQIRYLFAGDLLGQLIGSTFGVKDLNIPVFGLYGACSTMGESLSLASMCISGGFADFATAVTSSHFASAEKQFRFPLEYGNQRPLSATWTVTGSGAVVLSSEESDIKITGITTGTIMDYGIRDSMNMGASMAPAACNVIYQNLTDFNLSVDYYDKIITGDLGYIGQEILFKLLRDNGYEISHLHMDCGIEIYDNEKQDTHSGGSGCGCCASTLCGYIFEQLKKKVWKRILFVPTGALLSTVSFNEGQNIPSIAHGIMFERV